MMVKRNIRINAAPVVFTQPELPLNFLSAITRAMYTLHGSVCMNVCTTDVMRERKVVRYIQLSQRYGRSVVFEGASYHESRGTCETPSPIGSST